MGKTGLKTGLNEKQNCLAIRAEKFASGVKRRAAAHVRVLLRGASQCFRAQREDGFTVSNTANLSLLLLLIFSSRWRPNLMTCLGHRLRLTHSISTVRMAHARMTSNEH